MAERLSQGLGRRDQLQHVVASPAWDDGALWTRSAHGERIGWWVARPLTW